MKLSRKVGFVLGLPLVLFVGASQLAASPSQIFSSGNFLDPSPTVHGVGFETLASPIFAVSFRLNYSATLENVNLWSYDTNDGSGGRLTAIQYAIYTGTLQPIGGPIASGSGTNITLSSPPGHRYSCGPCAEGGFHTQFHSFDVEAPIDLNGQTPYWLVLSAVVDPSGVNARAEWAPSDGANSAFLFDYGLGSGFGSAGSTPRAFTLNGTPTSVPETSAIALIGIGLGALGYVRRKFRSQ